MNKMSKVAAGVVAIGLALAGCAGGASAPTTNESGQTVIRFGWWGNDTRNRLTQQAIDLFEQQNPDIRVQPEPGEWSGYWDRLATQMAAGDAPDVIQMDEKYIAEYANRGALLNLEEAGVDVSRFAEGTVDTGRLPGGLFGVNAGINSPTVIANPAVFEAAGVEIPDDTTWTWEDLATASKAISDADGSAVGSQNYTMVEPIMRVWLRQQGQDEFDENGVAFDAETLGRFFSQGLDLQNDGSFPSASVASEELTKPVDQTMGATNQLGLFYYWSNQVKAFDNASGQDLQILRPPSMNGDGEHDLWYKASMLWSASGRTGNQEAVVKLINFLANDVEAGKILGVERGVPANLDVRDEIRDGLEPSDAKIMAFLESIESELGEPMTITPVGGSDIELGRWGTEVIFERMTPQAAADGLTNELTAKVQAGA
ncbi:MAG: ABC transporter substrate-binding protein [Propionibacteriaceae bacterium]|nr:ABC transporter substrate-binding protein [Propionibacteriaceae bacterium]